LIPSKVQRYSNFSLRPQPPPPRDCGASLARIVLAPSPHPNHSPPQSNQHTARPPPAAPCNPSPAAASEPTNRPAMPESHKHPQQRSITNRSGQQYPGEIAAGGPATPEGLPGAKTRTRGAGCLTEAREKVQAAFGQSGNAHSRFGSESWFMRTFLDTETHNIC